MFWVLEVSLGILFGFSVLTHAFFWYESACGPHRAYLERLSRGRLTWWLLRGIFQGFASILLVCLFFPLGFMRSWRHPRARDQCSLPPVVLVHGLYHNASGWLLYRFWLKRAGFRKVYGFNYSSFGVSFEDVVARFGRFVEEVEVENPGQAPVLIGHSLGGVVARAFADAPDHAGRVKALVTLGSPHGGSKLAALSLGRLGQSLLYGGPLFEQLKRAPAPVGSHRLAIFSPMDTMVLPLEGLKIHDPGWKQLETSPVGHVGLLFHGPTARKAFAFLCDVVGPSC
jgi:pimeloyl-ACP methyl ester carboxylesterase